MLKEKVYTCYGLSLNFVMDVRKLFDDVVVVGAVDIYRFPPNKGLHPS